MFTCCEASKLSEKTNDYRDYLLKCQGLNDLPEWLKEVNGCGLKCVLWCDIAKCLKQTNNITLFYINKIHIDNIK